ncbi:YqaE/Pmp3 family membrane protein [Halomonas sp. MCCC 1A17488]|uniref:YqaE/Pmp3 family membrane protein n=1 Tax=Billgrantia sulfidoxydans TaxID=2733484 RepID=A0ABX7W7Y1_9GAMM|nr:MULTISPECIES: YqaE/Pmp3 family membrane protein [Halomonas]MCE8014518.1 YqaE/Pmp3 family membrane protein [Halomonas sp. MCCC 1A17488]MCG3237851.1 YqaE/Pmp3 family membrane protein [Halomonas sp. MCCC 1A17488]QPP48355.1 YqaE/Pmp3 family membrane protein [Halomonas sp. SS10-MC5]QTP55662.1 YqaE/Pmp3 family membrane protein [Halomonas sulfidoxydans]
MDAREYLARKGLDGSRDEERPNTLEEKAWERAREAGGHQPRAGTPFDWEDWERYHEALAEGAEAIDQKFDHQAHRQAGQTARTEREASTAVETYIPSTDAGPATGDARQARAPTSSAWQASAALRFSYKALAVLLPPLAVGLAQGGGRRVIVCLCLTLLGWVPGCIYAWSWLRRRLG